MAGKPATKKAPKRHPVGRYLDAIGAKGYSLEVPSVEQVTGDGRSPLGWMDAKGEAPPEGVQFHLVPGDGANTGASIRAAERKGYHPLSGDHGLRLVGRPTQEGDIVMMRTEEQRRVYLAAKAREEQRQREASARRQTKPLDANGGRQLGAMSEQIKITDAEIPIGPHTGVD